ncbi:hypothetical protein GCM10010269_69100 [Streptomyces humidus]|uniref:Uncharacterized protein n=1 Tax=Streptomyces humidus TaxID=52259 RepID=A0A918G5D0_9ACTN|nr:hypothetical protein GCM10010269_69100 [Streptomyces humidus]
MSKWGAHESPHSSLDLHKRPLVDPLWLHRWCALQQTLEVITGEGVSLTAPAENHWFLAKAVM